MKTKIYLKAMLVMALSGGFVSCSDYLDKEPLSSVSPELYFNMESHLQAYTDARYADVLPSWGNWSYGTYGADLHTDNMVSLSWDAKYVPGKWKTGMSDGNYSFTNINTINYFFDQVLPKYEAKQISGNDAMIRHYIGEMYFMRAWSYFVLLQRFGDFPIIKTCLPDDLAVLSENSRRYPCNEVARFILEDLDKAVDYMKDASVATTRISADVALLIKSRVALYEGSWLKNCAGTPFVPNGEGWPGATKEYNAGYQFPEGSLEGEYKWFFQQAMDAAMQVADKATLTQNTGIVPQQAEGESVTLGGLEAANPWLAMFGTTDLSGYKEVLLWRQYVRGLGVVHNVPVYAQVGNYLCGTTRGMVDAFVMKDGLPIYASPLYQGDTEISKVRADRDPRLHVLLKEPGQQNSLVNVAEGDHVTAIETVPNIMATDADHGYSTGYALRKGNSYDGNQCDNGQGSTACPVFRSVEALLNYIEASYEKNGSLDGTATQYWTRIRERHTGLDADFMKTVNATDIAEEAKGDWGAYTAGQLLSDKILYNIRRERRCELMAEDFRHMDLQRWRSYDQMMTKPYHVEGIHIWGTPMQNWYDQKKLKESISSPELSEYLRPFEAHADSEVIDGLKWSMAHYLRPMPIYQMMLTAPDAVTVADSPIYQNPYWPTEPNMPATK